MIDHELTDPAGGALTITHDHQGVWVTATEDRDEVTVGPFPVTSLTEAVTVESDAEVSGDLMDGGVTAAAIEAEVVSPERARSLVQEKEDLEHRLNLAVMASDHNSDRAEKAEQELEQSRRGYGALMDKLATTARQRDEADRRAATASPRPLAADDIPVREFEAMADRALARWDEAKTVWAPRDAMREAMRAALTEPTRPKGAEEIESQIEAWDHEYGFDAIMTAPRLRELADFLAERGVRVTRAEL